MLRFVPVPFTDVPHTDWRFFYSPRGVRYFYEQWDRPYRGHVATIGERTGTVVGEYGGQVSFVGTGAPEAVARQFDEVLRSGESVLFVRAENSRRSIQQFLPHIDQQDLVVYRNRPAPVRVPPADICVFTSPLNYQTFLQANTLQSHQKLIAIGPTTAAAIGPRCDRVADHPGEESLAAAVMSFSG